LFRYKADVDTIAIDCILLEYRAVSSAVRKRIMDMNIPCIFLSRIFSVNNYVSCNDYNGILAMAGNFTGKVNARIVYQGNFSNSNNFDQYRDHMTTLREAGLTSGRPLF